MRPQTMLTIDGSHGEGGGQILRSALALSMVTGRAVRIEKIRAGRPRPGLMRQHLTAVYAAQRVCSAGVEGAAIGSKQLCFTPGEVRAGEYHFAIGTAGSTTLVLQTLLPALCLADGPSTLVLEGGTHNPFAPPFDFLAEAFIPLLNRMGPRIELTLQRCGFYPAGGGRFTAHIEPAPRLAGLQLLECGAPQARRARAMVANLPPEIARRELKVVADKLGWPAKYLHTERIEDTAGPGNIVLLSVQSEHVTEVFTGFGERSRSAEAVADSAVQQCRRYRKANVPVGEYLADQLLLPLAIAGRGAFRTLNPTPHTRTHIALIRQFLEVPVALKQEGRDQWQVAVG